jgi:hypothetical protein
MIGEGEKLLYINKRSFTMYFVSLITVAMSIFVFYMIFSDLDGFFLEYSSRATGIAWMIFMMCCGNILLLKVLNRMSPFSLKYIIINKL